jgi:hypothetical protein
MVGESRLKFEIGDIVYVPRLNATGIVFKLHTERIIGIQFERIIGIQFFDPDPNNPQRYFAVIKENVKVLS